MNGGLAALLAGVAYVIVPGHQAVVVSGIPLGVTGMLVLVVLGIGYAWARHEHPVSDPPVAIVLALTVAVTLKVVFGILAPPAGWTAAYHANADFSPPFERSVDFRSRPDATRIDRAIDFDAGTFPVHFLNHQRYTSGAGREVSEPVSVRWRGQLWFEAPRDLTLSLEARGTARVRVNGVEMLAVVDAEPSTGVETTLGLTEGAHLIEVQYLKPAGVEPWVRLLEGEGDAARPLGVGSVTTTPVPEWRQALDGAFAVATGALHALTAGVVGWWLAPGLVRRFRQVAVGLRLDPVAALQPVVEPAVVLLLAAQGAWKARHLVDRVWTLTGGDDWLAYEAQAREVVLNGLLMPMGAAVGQGTPFLYYPGYTYVVALVHALGGEPLAVVVLANFLMLALALVIVHRLARLLVGPTCALAVLMWVFVLAQVDFVRYYTVTLLSENLYFLAVPAAVYGLTRYLVDPRWPWVVAAAAAGGFAALTRPSMMLFLPVGALIVVAARWRPGGGPRAVALGALFVAAWLAAVSPVTLRNYVMSGEPVLITKGQAVTFVDFNFPAGDHPEYKAAFDGSFVSAARILIWIAAEHPAEMLPRYVEKFGFSLGMVHWREGYAPHPELLLTSALYLLAVLIVPGARMLRAAPLHLFILTHLATLLLTQPWNYGYRMLLVMYLFMPIFAVAAVARLWRRR